MEPNNNNQPPANPAQSDPAVQPSTTPPPATNQATATPEAKGDQGGGRDMKKIGLIVVLLIVSLITLSVVGYYAYGSFGGSSDDTVPNQNEQLQPPVTPTPDVEVEDVPIVDDEELDDVIDEIDEASDEAELNEEVQGLQSDSNF